MTPIEDKAKELCQRYQRLLFIDTTLVNPDYIHPDSQKCALICVDEMIKTENVWKEFVKHNTGHIEESRHLEKLKKAINKL